MKALCIMMVQEPSRYMRVHAAWILAPARLHGQKLSNVLVFQCMPCRQLWAHTHSVHHAYPIRHIPQVKYSQSRCTCLHPVVHPGSDPASHGSPVVTYICWHRPMESMGVWIHGSVARHEAVSLTVMLHPSHSSKRTVVFCLQLMSQSVMLD